MSSFLDSNGLSCLCEKISDTYIKKNTIATASFAGLVRPVSVITKPTINDATSIIGKYYHVQMSSDGAMFVNVPWTDTNTKVTSVGNHYTPTSDSSSELTASLSGSAGAYAKNTEYTVVTGIKAQRDAKGHVTGITYTAQKIKDTDTTYTVNNAKLTLNVGGQSVNGNDAFTANDATNTTYNVPSATASAYGVVKVSSVNTSAVTVNSESTTTGRYYPIELTSDGKAIVNVPWTDNNTRVNVRARGTTKAYILATSTSPTSNDVAVTALAETGVYLDETVGRLTAASFYATSDKRLKENIKSYSCPNSILDLDVKSYDFINGNKNEIGCLAQDLQKICPEIVKEDKETSYLSINESKIVYLLLLEMKKMRLELDEVKGVQ